MRKAILTAFAAAAVLLSSTAAQALDKVTFLLDWIPSGEEPYPYVAEKEGFFKAEGLEVTVRSGRGSTDTITKLGTGTADFGGAAIGALMGAVAQSNVPVKAIASIYVKQPDAIFTVKGSGVTTLKDLTGRTIATAPFTSSNVIWPVFAGANGLDVSKITLIKADPNTLFGMLATGKTDATISWVTNKASAERVLGQNGKELVMMPWSDHGLDGYGLSLLATDKVIKEQPQVVARFLRAYTQAINFTFANPEAAAKDIHDMVPDIEVQDGLADWKSAAPLIKNEVSQKFGMWTFDPELVKKTWGWVAKGQNLPLDKIDPLAVVDQTFVPKS